VKKVMNAVKGLQLKTLLEPQAAGNPFEALAKTSTYG